MTLKQIRDYSLSNITAIMGEKIIDFRVEQFESNGKNEWDVVVSFLTENINQPEATTGLMAISAHVTRTPYERVFKRLLMDNSGGLIKLLMFKE